MKKSIFIFFIIIMLLLLTACGEKQKPIPPITDSVSAQNTNPETEPQKQTVQKPPETQEEKTEPEYTHAVFELSIVETLLSNDSLGQEWFNVYCCNDEYISSGKRWIVPLDKTETVTIDAFLTEDDEHPDTTFISSTVVLSDKFETTKIVQVTENHGRYKGKSALWEITYKVSLVDRLVK